MPPMPRLQSVKPATAPRRRHPPALTGASYGQAIAAACLLAGLAAVAGALALIYLPAGIMAAGLMLAGGAVAYTFGSRGRN